MLFRLPEAREEGSIESKHILRKMQTANSRMAWLLWTLSRSILLEISTGQSCLGTWIRAWKSIETIRIHSWAMVPLLLTTTQQFGLSQPAECQSRLGILKTSWMFYHGHTPHTFYGNMFLLQRRSFRCHKLGRIAQHHRLLGTSILGPPFGI